MWMFLLPGLFQQLAFFHMHSEVEVPFKEDNWHLIETKDGSFRKDVNDKRDG